MRPVSEVPAELSEAALERLHEVCLRGACADPGDDHAALLMTSGLVATGPRGLRPLPVGRALVEKRARLSHGSDARDAAVRAYDAFLPVDRQVKQAVTAWQLRGAASRECLDTEDWKLVDRIRDADERMAPQLRRLGDVVPRFAAYRPRLAQALRRVEEGGEHAYLCGVTVDSFHTVWWQLHQELMWALGIDRAEDPNQ